jgi:hypothetical protein
MSQPTSEARRKYSRPQTRYPPAKSTRFAYPLGATLSSGGVNFAVFSERATGIEDLSL